MGHSPEEAFDSLGIVGGDDGLARDIDKDMYVAITKSLGHVLKAETLTAGDPVPFLGRYYLDAWTDNTSVSDIQRQARKFHVSTSPLIISNEECLLRKALGYLATDQQTPLISHWSRAVVRVLSNTTEVRSEHDQHDVSWFARQGNTQEQQWPQRPRIDWQQAWDFAASQLQTETRHLVRVCRELDAAVNLADFPILCFTLPIAEDVAVSVGGTLLGPIDDGDAPAVAAAGADRPQPSGIREGIRDIVDASTQRYPPVGGAGNGATRSIPVFNHSRSASFSSGTSESSGARTRRRRRPTSRASPVHAVSSGSGASALNTMAGRALSTTRTSTAE